MAEPIAVKIPRAGANDDTVVLSQWLAQDGAKVQAGAKIAVVETSKAVFELDCPASGYLRRVCAEGAQAAVGEEVAYVTQSPDAAIPAARAPQDAAAGPRFSRKAEALAKDHGLSAADFSGRGMVSEADVLDEVARRGGAPAPWASRRLKQAEAAALGAGQNFLTSTVAVACPAAWLAAAGKRCPGLGGSALPVLIVESARLLKEFPRLNASKSEVHVAFAVDGDRGLKAPVIFNADKKDIAAVEREVQDLLLDYETNALKPAALNGGTFTISDLSREDVLSFSPLVNYGQSAILGVSAPSILMADGKVGAALSLTFDHRHSEGREAARFLRALRAKLHE